MIKTNKLSEYVALIALKTYCDNCDDDCDKCKIADICDCMPISPSYLEIEYECEEVKKEGH